MNFKDLCAQIVANQEQQSSGFTNMNLKQLECASLDLQAVYNFDDAEFVNTDLLSADDWKVFKEFDKAKQSEILAYLACKIALMQSSQVAPVAEPWELKLQSNEAAHQKEMESLVEFAYKELTTFRE
jgi:hypothetical protein